MESRKKLRLSEFDYSLAGAYFVTICTKNKQNFFGKIQHKKMCVNRLGGLVYDVWKNILNHFDKIELGEFVIMPNHIHFILWIVGDSHGCPLPKNVQLIPKIVSQFKSTITREIRKKFNDQNFSWQRSFYDRVIRDEKELNSIREYILYNPLEWKKDKYFV